MSCCASGQLRKGLMTGGAQKSIRLHSMPIESNAHRTCGGPGDNVDSGLHSAGRSRRCGRHSDGGDGNLTVRGRRRAVVL